MYLSLDWIKQWVKLPKDLTPKQLALDFTMSTVEVEEVIDQSAALTGIVVGKIKELTKHPQADRLQVCQVDLGDAEEQIVCGGSNLSKGMLVAVAKVGAKVKWHGQGELVVLEEAKIRGVVSRGMICASEEIGLASLFPAKSEKEILDLSDFKLKTGQPLAEALHLNDIIIDIDNKSINHRPDLWGQYGLARELAAIYSTKFKSYELAEIKPKKEEVKLKVNVKDKAKCFRYLGVAVKNVKVSSSPWWLKTKLQAVGIRSINNIVDVTNYVMYELGQPLHAFDLRQLEGEQIEVKTAQANEEFITLDGIKRELPAEALMIADKKKYIAIAGIMGGQNSEIGLDTTDIVIESANFQASNIRRTSTALGLRSEASSRFEKSLDPRLAELAIKRAVELILELCPEAYVASSLVDVDNNPFNPITLTVPESLINDRFGAIIPHQQIKSILERLQFGVKYKSKIFTINVPSWRATKDISIPEDIVEEVARIYGYDNIKPTLPSVALQAPVMDISYQAAKEIVNWLCLAQHYDEVYTYPFTDKAWVKKLNLDLKNHLKVKNAVSPEQEFLNVSLLPNLLQKAEDNTRFFSDFKIFELQRVFDKSNTSIYHTDNQKANWLPMQDKFLSGVEVSKQPVANAWLQVKGLINSLSLHWSIDWHLEKIKLPFAAQAYELKYQDMVLGKFGLLTKELFDSNNQDLSIAWWEINFTLASKYISNNKTYEALSKYPSVNRDLAVVLDQKYLWEDIAKEVKNVSSLIVRLEPFDVFAGAGIPAGQKSLAWHLEFRSPERTLLADEVDEIMKEIVSVLEKKFQARSR